MNKKILIILTILVFILNTLPVFSQTDKKTATSIETVDINNDFFKFSLKRSNSELHNIKLKLEKFDDDLLQLSQNISDKLFNYKIAFRASSENKTVVFDDNNQIYSLKREILNDKTEEFILSSQVSGTSETDIKLTVKKTFLFNKESHIIEFKLKIKNDSDTPVKITSIDKSEGLKLGLISMLGKSTIDDYAFVKLDGDFDSQLLGTEDLKEKWEGNIDYAGVMDHYFVSVLNIGTQKAKKVEIESFDNSAFKNKKEEGYPSTVKIVFPQLELESREARVYDFTILISQKSYKLLENYKLEEICELNFLSLLIMKILFLLYDLTTNWGLSIILLTLGIKIMLHPLTMKQTRSMKEMQKIQPLMKDIQAKYKDNPTKMNEEVMKLYREHNINPLSGCLPLLIQIPILIALFTSLRNSIELRGEGFLWIKDLSGADPLYILPLLIVVSMHFQQKQMNVDPNQAAAMKFMPIFMLFICLTLPSGVLIYWVVSNVLQIVQQSYDPKDSKTETAVTEKNENPKKDEPGKKKKKKR